MSVRLPGWLVFVVFAPLQIWLFLKLFDAWGWGWTVLSFLVLGLIGTRAARPGFFRETFFPRWAQRWERRRHLYLGVLLLGAGITFFTPLGPQPWLPAAMAATLVKASVK